jgi:hypothetical protein
VRRAGRSKIYAARYSSMRALLAANCCEGAVEECGPEQCGPAEPSGARNGGDESDRRAHRAAARSLPIPATATGRNSTPALADGADLLIAECYFYSKHIRFHLNYPTVKEHRDLLRAKRVILTHMAADMLSHAGSVPEEKAHDGLVIEL